MADEFTTNHQTETFKSLITISLDIFKGLILINGGAAAGMVATLDKLTKVIHIGAIQASMGLFVGGLLAAVVASSCAYFTQLALHEENMGREVRGKHHRWVIAVTIFCILSMACFGAGGLVAALSIRPVLCA
ncbi:hypothetical protein [Polaromonas sp.]|uniref:hypothetical protein n=1 Tax=Polaromonas sp. TaxID=1869339 RepID=UPI0032640F5A